MAQVTRRDITVPSIGVPKIPTPGPSPLTGLGEAFGIAAKFIQAKNQEILRTKEVDYQTTSLSQFRTFADKLQNQLKPNFGSNLEGYADAYARALQDQIKLVSDGAPSPASRNVIVSQLGQVMDSFSRNARRDEENAVISTAGANLDLSVNSYISDTFRNPDNIQENLALIEEAVDSADWIKDKSKAAEFKRAKENEAWIMYARYHRENEPKELLADVNDGFYDDKLKPEQITALKDQADAEIFRNERRARAETARALRALRKDVNEHAFVTERGQEWDGDANSTRQALIDLGTPEAEELLEFFDESISLGGELKKFSSLTVPQMEQDILANAFKPTDKRGLRLQERKIRAFKHTQDAINKGLGFDLMVQRGLIKAPEPFDTTDPTIRDAQLEERIDMANTARSYLGVEVSPFTAAEKSNFIRTIRGTNLDAQEGLLQFLGGLPAGMRRRTANDLSKDAPEFAVAIDIAAPNGAGARRIMDGLQVMRNEQARKAVPPDKDFTPVFNQEVGQAFSRSAAHQNAIFQAAKAVYVSKMFEKGQLRQDELDETVYKESLEEVTGGIIERDTRLLDPGHKILPPVWGMSANEFDSLLDNPERWADIQQNVTPENARRNGTFIHKGAGQYIIMMPNDQVLLDKEGKQFVLDFSDIDEMSPEEKASVDLKRSADKLLSMEFKAL